jgi:hypothetical protein
MGETAYGIGTSGPPLSHGTYQVGPQVEIVGTTRAAGRVNRVDRERSGGHKSKARDDKRAAVHLLALGI